MLKPQEVYHERQTLYRCGLHALNNVLQGPVFTQTILEDACEELNAMTGTDGLNPMAWIWNPHRAPFKLGNYDINVLTFVLQHQGYTMQWLDKRQPVDEKVVDFNQVEGILCNVVLSTLLSTLWTQRHWFALRKIAGICYNLDSKLAAPMAFATETACYKFLQELVDTGECEVFTIQRMDLTTVDS